MKKEKEISINILFATIHICIEADKNLSNYINEKYKNNLKEALNCSKKNKHYNNKIFQEGSIQKNIIGNRLIGLYELFGDQFILDLLNKINFKFFNNIKNKKIVCSNEIYKYFEQTYVFLKRINKNDELGDFVLASLIYLNSIKYIELESYEGNLNCLELQIKMNRFKFTMLKSNKGKQVTERWGFQIKSFDDLHKEMEKIDNKIYLLATYIMDQFDFNIGSLNITKKEIQNIASLYFEIFKNKEINTSLINIYYTMAIYMLIKENKNIKDMYFENHKDNVAFEIEDLKNKLESLGFLNQDLKTQIKKLEDSKNILTSKNNILQKELNIFLKNKENKENKNLKELKKIKNKNKELREFLKSSKEQLEACKEELKASNKKIETNYIDKLKIYLYENNLKLAILGGQPGWQKKIEETFNSSIIEIYRKDVKYDYILIKTDSISHSQTFEIENKLFVNKNNLQEVSKEILDIFCKK